jgi:hypothetical protein
MERLALGEVFHGHDLGAVHLAEQQDAGVDGLVDEAAVLDPSDRHRAGAAIALGAAFLRARAALLKAR